MHSLGEAKYLTRHLLHYVIPKLYDFFSSAETKKEGWTGPHRLPFYGYKTTETFFKVSFFAFMVDSHIGYFARSNK